MDGLILFFQGFIDFADRLFYEIADFLVCEDFLTGIDKKYIYSSRGHATFQSSPAFPDPSFEQVSLDCSLKQFLGYRYQNTVAGFPASCRIDVAELAKIAMPAFGKKPFDAFLAA